MDYYDYCDDYSVCQQCFGTRILRGEPWEVHTVFLSAPYILFLGELSLIKCDYFDNISTDRQRR